MKLVQSGMYIIGILALIVLCQYLTESRGVFHYEEDGKDHLYDLFHQLLPDWHSYQWVINILPLMILVYTLFLPNGFKVLRATLMMFLVVLGIRALTIVGTILPKHVECIPEKNPFINLLQGGGCYDKIFSGHTAFFVLMTLNLLDYGYLTTPVFWGLNAFNIGALLLTRAHYTVDVVLGFIIAYLVFDGEYRLFGGVAW